MSSWGEPLTPAYPTGFIDPTQNIQQLETALSEKQEHQPFSLVIDLTRGKLLPFLNSLKEIPSWTTFSVGRVREATSVELPTTGHIVSHNRDEVTRVLSDHNLEHILVLDDTSFSGTTSLLIEQLIRAAAPQKTIQFTHGFLILNQGKLVPHESAQQQLQKAGSSVVGGRLMNTPIDDGWHFFDMVGQANFDQHFLAVLELIRLLRTPEMDVLVSSFLANQETLELLFPRLMPDDTLRELEKTGHFIARKTIRNGFHVRNPQLLPNIIGQGHLLPPEEWQGNTGEITELLATLNHLLLKGTS